MRCMFPCFLLIAVLLLPVAAHADALARPGFSVTHLSSADYRLPWNDAEERAWVTDISGSWKVNRRVLATLGLKRSRANVVALLGGGYVEELRLVAGATWRNAVNSRLTVSLAGDLLLADLEGNIVDPAFSDPCNAGDSVDCPARIHVAESDAGAEASAGFRMELGDYVALAGSGGYQVLGDDHGPVLRFALSVAPAGNAALELLYFDEPRITGFGVGLRLRFGRADL